MDVLVGMLVMMAVAVAVVVRVVYSPVSTPVGQWEALEPTMEENGTDDVQTKSNATHDENQFRLFNVWASVSYGDIKRTLDVNPRCRETKRSIACRKMLIPRARRKTPLKNAPRSEARCHPKERSWGDWLLSEIWSKR